MHFLSQCGEVCDAIVQTGPQSAVGAELLLSSLLPLDCLSYHCLEVSNMVSQVISFPVCTASCNTLIAAFEVENEEDTNFTGCQEQGT